MAFFHSLRIIIFFSHKCKIAIGSIYIYMEYISCVGDIHLVQQKIQTKIKMVQANIKISDSSNQVVNVVKAKYNLKDKSAAIDLIIDQYAEIILEPGYRPISELEFSDEFIAETLEDMKEKPIGHFKNAEDLRAHIKGCR